VSSFVTSFLMVTQAGAKLGALVFFAPVFVRVLERRSKFITEPHNGSRAGVQGA
jgi:hypothetical protein